jgi:hypothetical protein
MGYDNLDEGESLLEGVLFKIRLMITQHKECTMSHLFLHMSIETSQAV